MLGLIGGLLAVFIASGIIGYSLAELFTKDDDYDRFL